MIITIKEIIERSGDSVLYDYKYMNGRLILYLEMDEFDRNLCLRIRTNKLECRNLEKLSNMERTCRINLVKLNDFMKVQNGFYIAANPFPEFMKECRNGFNLAYGLQSSERTYLLSIVGYSRLITCIIISFDDDIEWEFGS